MKITIEDKFDLKFSMKHDVKPFTLSALSVSVVGLERALAAYLKDSTVQPFDMKTVPIATVPLHEQKTLKTSR